MKCRTRQLHRSEIKREREKKKRNLHLQNFHILEFFEESRRKFKMDSHNVTGKRALKKLHKIRGDKAWFRYNRPDRLYFLKNQQLCGSVSIGEGIVNENLNY